MKLCCFLVSFALEELVSWKSLPVFPVGGLLRTESLTLEHEQIQFPLQFFVFVHFSSRFFRRKCL